MAEQLAIRKKSELIKLARYRFNLDINVIQTLEKIRISYY